MDVKCKLKTCSACQDLHAGINILKIWQKKGQLLQNGYSDLLKNCRVGRSWHAEYVCSLNLTSISYSFWNKGQKVHALQFWSKSDYPSRSYCPFFIIF
jgi:hypothetical protein